MALSGDRPSGYRAPGNAPDVQHAGAGSEAEGHGGMASPPEMTFRSCWLPCCCWRSRGGLKQVALLSRWEGNVLKGIWATAPSDLGHASPCSRRGALLAVGSVPEWAHGLSPFRGALASVQIAYFLALPLIYFLLVGAAARAAHGELSPARLVSWTLGGVAVLTLLALGMRWTCMPGGQVEPFHLRARALSSGVCRRSSRSPRGWQHLLLDSPGAQTAAVDGAAVHRLPVTSWTIRPLSVRPRRSRRSTACCCIRCLAIPGFGWHRQ